MGKGSDRRPAQVPDKEIESNWRRTFGKTRPKPFGLLKRLVDGDAKRTEYNPEAKA